MFDGHRYIVKFTDGGAAMRRFDQPLELDGILQDCGVTYRVVHLERPRTPTGLGHATVTPD